MKNVLISGESNNIEEQSDFQDIFDDLKGLAHKNGLAKVAAHEGLPKGWGEVFYEDPRFTIALHATICAAARNKKLEGRQINILGEKQYKSLSFDYFGDDEGTYYTFDGELKTLVVELVRQVQRSGKDTTIYGVQDFKRDYKAHIKSITDLIGKEPFEGQIATLMKLMNGKRSKTMIGQGNRMAAAMSALDDSNQEGKPVKQKRRVKRTSKKEVSDGGSITATNHTSQQLSSKVSDTLQADESPLGELLQGRVKEMFDMIVANNVEILKEGYDGGVDSYIRACKGLLPEIHRRGLLRGIIDQTIYSKIVKEEISPLSYMGARKKADFFMQARHNGGHEYILRKIEGVLGEVV